MQINNFFLKYTRVLEKKFLSLQKTLIMQNIPMVDLVGQYNKIKPEVDNAIQEILSTAAFINGPYVKKFQEDLQQYLNVKHVIPCANGTDALQVAMMALNLEPGDEVITTTFTFIATAEVIALLRLKPVLVDIEKDSYNIDPVAVERAITPKTKAIVPVHTQYRFRSAAECKNIQRRRMPDGNGAAG